MSEVQDWLKEMRSGIIVMASVFVALSFWVALTPPGGMWSDWGPNGSTNVTAAHQPGKPILYDLNPKLFKKLMEFNRPTFFCSIATIILIIQPFSPQSSLVIFLVLYVAILPLLFMVTEFLYMDLLLTGKSFNIPGIIKTNFFSLMLIAFAFFIFLHSTLKRLNRNLVPPQQLLSLLIEFIDKRSNPRCRKFIAKFKSLVRKIVFYVS
ncbi:UNVERIFIED_CONTAM: hypothetical protein Sradi_5752300 [Sesamum radiatum]|uniref:PGG domain-containing protein n=1 Tax=Sesamum radiatum TaxID=300843 RepID=A0AAW2L2L6_SESRA